MSACTFFGHRDCPTAIKPKLREAVIELIEKEGVDVFYVGNQGAFDRIARSVLRELSADYPRIRYAVVLERVPEGQPESAEDTLVPEGIETAHPRYAIARRNEWMLRQCGFAIVYIKHSWGGAARYAELARRRKITMINLAESQTVALP